jgi:hypothetical protein
MRGLKRFLKRSEKGGVLEWLRGRLGKLRGVSNGELIERAWMALLLVELF